MKGLNIKNQLSEVVKRAKFGFQKAFTLPEVIISFSILILVITSATGILVSVIRSNNDNVNSLVAYGLAQEGVESARFIRDSNSLLGLGFDGGKKDVSSSTSIWTNDGPKLFEGAGVKFFALDLKSPDESDCGKNGLKNCLPLHLRVLSGNEESLKSAVESKVFKKGDQSGSGSTETTIFYQATTKAAADSDSGFHRYLRIESNARTTSTDPINKLRISSVVSWIGSAGQVKDLVLSTELTNWK